MMDLGYILRRARAITWRHKALWLFGLLIGLGTASTRFGMASVQRESAVKELPPDVQGPILDFLDSPYFIAAVVVFALLGLAFSAGLSLLNSLGRVGLVHQARAAEEYGVVVLKGGWLAAKRHLWRVFIIHLLLNLPMAVVILTGALPSIATWLLTVGQDPDLAILGDLGAGVLRLTCLAPAWCVAALLSVPTGVLRRLAVRACVLEGLDVHGSFARAREILREHLGKVALTWLILLSIGAGVSFLVGLPLGVAWLLSLLIARLTIFASPLLSIALTLLVGLLTWAASIAIVGLAETFFSVTWTLVYRELTGMGRTGEEVGALSTFAPTQG